MSDFQQRDMSGALFKNERKQEGDDYPDYQGSVTIKGTQYALGAWVKKSKAGKKYMSIAVRPWQEKGTKQLPKGTAAPTDNFEDDSIPF